MPDANTSFHESPLELFANVVHAALMEAGCRHLAFSFAVFENADGSFYAEPFDELSTVDAETLERAEAIARGACHG